MVWHVDKYKITFSFVTMALVLNYISLINIPAM